MPRRGENIRKRKDGRWEGRYIKSYDQNGKAKYGSVYAKTYIEVKRKLNSVNEIEKNKNCTTSSNILFREILYLWLDNKKCNMKVQTYAKYLQLIDNHLVPYIESISVNEVNVIYVNRLLAEKSDYGRLDGCGGLSPSYVKTIAFIVNSSLDFASQNGFCQPLNGDIISPRLFKREIDILSIVEQIKLEKYLFENTGIEKLGIILSLYAGLRIGEICGLRWEDIDFDERLIHVKYTVERIKNIGAKSNEPKTSLILSNVKSASSDRYIPMPNKLYQILKEYRCRNKKFVLPGESYDFTDPRNYQYVFRKCLLKANIRKINYHALRHTFATRCIESGMDVKTLSEILGHASVNITLNTYVHSSLDHKRNQMETMIAYLGQ